MQEFCLQDYDNISNHFMISSWSIFLTSSSIGTLKRYCKGQARIMFFFIISKIQLTGAYCYYCVHSFSTHDTFPHIIIMESQYIMKDSKKIMVSVNIWIIRFFESYYQLFDAGTVIKAPTVGVQQYWSVAACVVRGCESLKKIGTSGVPGWSPLYFWILWDAFLLLSSHW